MRPEAFLRDIVDPSLKKLAEWTGKQSDDRARVLVTAIAGQESAWSFRRQVGGPARSYWQFEQGGGVAGLLNFPSTKISAVCAALDVPYDIGLIFEAMAWNDTLACCMARLLLWTDARPLPVVGDVQAGWDYYVSNWRPGLPHPDKWTAVYGIAEALVGASKTPISA
jgi:hypothetical protein